jgi:hypothetical protein
VDQISKEVNRLSTFLRHVSVLGAVEMLRSSSERVRVEMDAMLITLENVEFAAMRGILDDEVLVFSVAVSEYLSKRDGPWARIFWSSWWLWFFFGISILSALHPSTLRLRLGRRRRLVRRSFLRLSVGHRPVQELRRLFHDHRDAIDKHPRIGGPNTLLPVGAFYC